MVLAPTAPAELPAAPGTDPLLARCVEVSRRMGREGLALHGGGNASVKSTLANGAGAALPALWVKGSGRNLAHIDAGGFVPLDLAAVRRLLARGELGSEVLARELRRASLDPAAPAPSTETLSHAALPHRYVLHAHPDALLALAASPGGARRVRRLLAPHFLLLPWVPPGIALGRAVADLWRREGSSRTRGIVLLHHGVFTFAEEAEEAWETLLDCERCAARALSPAPRSAPPGEAVVTWTALDVATLRHELCELAGRPLVLAWEDSPAALGFAGRADVAALVARGPLAPDHVLRTKRHAAVVPGPGRTRAALAHFAREYRDYFHRCAAGHLVAMRDPAPRVVVAPGAGIFAAGECAAEAAATLDIYRHTVEALLAAEGVGGHRPLPASALFAVEYGLESAHRIASGNGPLRGSVALVTGAAGGLGGAVVDELLAAGAAVAGLDLLPTPDRAGYLGLRCDTSDAAALAAAVGATVRAFGGIDLLVSNLAAAPHGATTAERPLADWQRTLQFDVTAHLAALRATLPLLERAAAPPAVVLLGGHDGPDPGPLRGSLAASRTALAQLTQVAARDLAASGIRVNTLHSDVVVPGAGGYRRCNLLRAEVRARDVARLAVALCTDLFACTTGAQIPVDGGAPQPV